MSPSRSSRRRPVAPLQLGLGRGDSFLLFCSAKESLVAHHIGPLAQLLLRHEAVRQQPLRCGLCARSRCLHYLCPVMVVTVSARDSTISDEGACYCRCTLSQRLCHKFVTHIFRLRSCMPGHQAQHMHGRQAAHVMHVNPLTHFSAHQNHSQEIQTEARVMHLSAAVWAESRPTVMA